MTNSNPYAAKSSSKRTQPKEVDTTPKVPSGTVKEVLEWVGDDKEKAAQALEAEKDGAKRSTLISTLEEIVDE